MPACRFVGSGYKLSPIFMFQFPFSVSAIASPRFLVGASFPLMYGGVCVWPTAAILCQPHTVPSAALSYRYFLFNHRLTLLLVVAPLPIEGEEEERDGDGARNLIVHCGGRGKGSIRCPHFTPAVLVWSVCPQRFCQPSGLATNPFLRHFAHQLLLPSQSFANVRANSY